MAPVVSHDTRAYHIHHTHLWAIVMSGVFAVGVASVLSMVIGAGSLNDAPLSTSPLSVYLHNRQSGEVVPFAQNAARNVLDDQNPLEQTLGNHALTGLGVHVQEIVPNTTKKSKKPTN